MRKLLAAAFVLMLMAGCYGRASPQTCYAKFIRDQRGGPDSYERCMAKYEARERVLAERRQGLRPSRARMGAAIALGIVGVAVAVRQDEQQRIRCADGWLSGCRTPHQGCCSHHGGYQE